ncbi:Macrolide export ATP-binding/permease protein MacB [Aquisphaera giovannonii]|uniref:Macrolide export ATP-binding/permease protein MacB n=1 Tax=Aquisphaera giovannonii TaxID=406548 RepID=A0A5B9VWE6_9BACT|nr:ABC transporter permease [Aquisphaera giovannonii]QEH32552.1 Macrolide export ATP-binding/permease protein MacB [Aquisphaera giovannonii]
MGRFAWRNLLTRPLRTILALVGLSVPILGVMGLFSVSDAVRNLVGETLSRIEGLMLTRENAFSPVVSSLPARLADDLRKLPGVRAVAPEVWGIAPPVEGQGLLVRGVLSNKGMASLFDQPVVSGQDIPSHENLRSAVFPRALKENGEGRFLTQADRGTTNVVISRKLARDFPRADGKPRQLGDTLRIGDRTFTIVGLYETGSMLLDVVIVMDIDTARQVVNVGKDTVSSIYVEGTDTGNNDALSERIEEAFPGVDARGMNEVQANFGNLMGHVDRLLMLVVSLALVVGIVGIINTMLMSTTERFTEFGVLRTNGWSEGNILTLVTLESAFLGLLSGLVGCALALAGTGIINRFLSGGVHLGVTPAMLAMGMALSVVMGTLGGLYPAWRAARLVPMEAIRIGSH